MNWGGCIRKDVQGPMISNWSPANASLFTSSGVNQFQIFAWIHTWNWPKDAQAILECREYISLHRYFCQSVMKEAHYHLQTPPPTNVWSQPIICSLSNAVICCIQSLLKNMHHAQFSLLYIKNLQSKNTFKKCRKRKLSDLINKHCPIQRITQQYQTMKVKRMIEMSHFIKHTADHWNATLCASHI